MLFRYTHLNRAYKLPTEQEAERQAERLLHTFKEENPSGTRYDIECVSSSRILQTN